MSTRKVELDFQKMDLRSKNNDLSTVHENDYDLSNANTLTNENVKLLEKRKILEKFMDANDNKDYDNADDFEDLQYDSDKYSRIKTASFDSKIKNQLETLQRRKINQITPTNIQTPRRYKSSLKSTIPNTPMGAQMYTLTEKHTEQEQDSGGSSISSRTPSSIQSQYSESDTENSDYAADYDDFGDDYEYKYDGMNLAQIFQKKQQEARKRAEDEQKLIYQQYMQSVNKRYRRPDLKIDQKYIDSLDYDDDDIEDITNDGDFENINAIDPAKLYKFKSNSAPLFPNCSTVEKKKSTPVIRMGTSVNGSPKKVKKYMSTTDMNSKLEKIPNSAYPIFNQDRTRHGINGVYYVDNDNEFDDLESIEDFNDTVTDKNYNKFRRRKDKKIDFSKYTEVPSRSSRKQRKHQNHRIRNSGHYMDGDSQTARLTKEGKIKLIRSLGKPKVRKVVPGHIYGEIVYDPDLKKWCGNEEDLVRFDTINHSKPQLIKKKESLPHVVGNMVYDDKKLRWVSITGAYEDDPFDDEDDDTVIKNDGKVDGWKANVAPPRSGINRGVSGKLVPSESTMSLADHLKKKDNYYKVTPEMYKNWKMEESRWVRKVGNWFPDDSNDIHKFKYDLKLFLNQQ